MKAARVYARIGWAVVPLHDVSAGACSCRKPDCPSAGKHPRGVEWQKAATSDPEIVDGWIAAYPRGNVGVATGEPSGFFVLDVDADKGGNEAFEALIAEHGPLPVTPEQETGSKGRHLLFVPPEGYPWPTNSKGALPPGIDIRGNGGQIVVAPSVSAKGPYRWLVPPTTPIAEAPAWLMDAIGTKPERSTASHPGASSEDRGFFPAASPEVLAEARAALEQFGPAIDGDNGGLRTVQAAAIVTHDFALTDEEAWPLFVEWNETCVPPWELEGENSLREKFENGKKYGKADYGARRSMDAVEVARKLITDWQSSGAPEPAMFKVIEEVRKCAARCADPAKRAVIEKELTAATGISARDLALPKPRVHEQPKPGEIEVTPRLHEVADASIKAIAKHVFQRGGVLCEVVRQPTARLSDLETARIQDLMSQSATYVRTDDKGVTEQQAPERAAAVLHARRAHPVRVIEAVTTAPIFLADGSILSERGYNAQARVYLEPSVEVSVPDEPSRADAQAAARLFVDLLSDFKFQNPKADFGAWLAGLLTPLVKTAIGYEPAPLFCVSASNAGAGKTLLTKLIARIVTGDDGEIRPYNPKDPAEWGKRLTAFVRGAAPVNVFDNVNGPFGDEQIDRLLTARTWGDRILGVSDAPPLPIVSTWFATGNNIEPIGDTVRRVLLIRIEVDVDRPQEREDFRYKPIETHVKANRSAYLGAALTILRAFHVADRPLARMPAYASFEEWSALVRGAIIWTCGPSFDPYITQRRAQLTMNDAVNDAHDFWISVVEGSADGVPASIVAAANQEDAAGRLGARSQITTYSLNGFVGRFIDKPRHGKRIRRDVDEARGTRFYVEQIRK